MVETAVATPTTVWYPTKQWQPGETIKLVPEAGARRITTSFTGLRWPQLSPAVFGRL